MRRSDWPRLTTPPKPRPAPPPRHGGKYWGEGVANGAEAGVRPPLSLRCPRDRALPAPGALRGAVLTPCSPPPPTPALTQSPTGGGPGPFASRVCGCRAAAAPPEGRGYAEAARCGVPAVLLGPPAALPGAGHVERPSPAPLGRAGTGDPGRERDERDAGPSSLLMSASGGDRLLPAATRPSALGPARATGNAAGAAGHC